MLNTISIILNIVLGLLTVYFYLENRKLKGYEIEKKIELLKNEIEKLKGEHAKNLTALFEEMTKRNALKTSTRDKKQNDLDQEYNYKFSQLQSELKYLERLKRYKWIFSK